MYAELNLGTRTDLSGLSIYSDRGETLFTGKFHRDNYADLLRRVDAILSTHEGITTIRLSRYGAGAMFADMLESRGYTVVDPE